MGLEKIVENRIGKKSMGFGADVQRKQEKKLGDILARVQPDDLMKYGFIPEFVGRLPVVATLHELDEEALVKILTEPKNALIKQYSKFFEQDGVKLTFNDDSLVAVAKKSLKQETGARGLRSILEDIMIDIMYGLPALSLSGVTGCVITGDVINKREDPLFVYENEAKARTG